MRTECVILIGLPASGKTTFYRARLAETHTHVSLDRLGHQRNAQRRQQQLVSEALASGRPVVVDNTNASREVRAGLIALARSHGAEVAGYYFPTTTADALRRNRGRQGRERVPDVAIFAIERRLEPPSLREGFDRLSTVRLNESDGSFDEIPHPT